MITFDEYQVEAEKTAIYLNKVKKIFPNLPKGVYKILGLAYVGNGLGEVGEIQGKIKKIIRDSGGIVSDEAKGEIMKEIGDVLWYIAAICKELGLNMGGIAEMNLKKLASRQERGVLEGSGDNR